MVLAPFCFVEDDSAMEEVIINGLFIQTLEDPLLEVMVSLFVLGSFDECRCDPSPLSQGPGVFHLSEGVLSYLLDLLIEGAQPLLGLLLQQLPIEGGLGGLRLGADVSHLQDLILQSLQGALLGVVLRACMNPFHLNNLPCKVMGKQLSGGTFAPIRSW